MAETPETTQIPRIELNGPAPDFEATTTEGVIRLSEWAKNRWVILFSHPADFTPVCTTEFMAFAKVKKELEKRRVSLLGTSVDSVYSHIAWIRNIKERFDVDIDFPIIADLDMRVAQLYGMLHAPSSNTAAVRAVFFIDPKRTVRAMIYYPLNVGRNFDEILRVVTALQLVDERGVATPANWRPGDEVIVPPPLTRADADKRLADESLSVTDWYFAKKAV